MNAPIVDVQMEQVGYRWVELTASDGRADGTTFVCLVRADLFAADVVQFTRVELEQLTANLPCRKTA